MPENNIIGDPIRISSQRVRLSDDSRPNDDGRDYSQDGLEETVQQDDYDTECAEPQERENEIEETNIDSSEPVIRRRSPDSPLRGSSGLWLDYNNPLGYNDLSTESSFNANYSTRIESTPNNENSEDSVLRRAMFNALESNGRNNTKNENEKIKKPKVAKMNSSGRKCSICSGDDFVQDGPGFYFCKNCMELFFSKCERCGSILDKEDVFPFGSSNLCFCCLNGKGARSCNSCKKWVGAFREVKDYGSICLDCMNDSLFFKCKECNGYYKRERYGINNCCINCTNAKLVEVQNYSFKPMPKFYSKKSGIGSFSDEELFFGVELEMGGASNPDVVNEFTKDCASTFFYMKKDTSIPVYGCEVVTQPATMQKHLEMTYWESLLKTAKEYGLSADLERCGIHVHISRSFFNNNECAKMDCFVNLYQDFWKNIARRESHYSAYIDKNLSSWGMQTSDRRCALNLSNQETIELRIFKGSLEYKTVMAYIELCHALSMFAKMVDIKLIVENKEKTLMFFKDIIFKSNYKFIPQYCERYNIF